MHQISLDGKIALVTGAGGGIGRACAESLAQAGARLGLADRKLKPLDVVAEELGAKAFGIDIAEEQEVRAMLETAEHSIGPIDILVNCAGTLQNFERPEELTMDNWDRITRVHLRGTYMLTTAMGTRMARRGRGAIVTVASIAGMRSAPLHAYAPAKAGLIAQTECLAAEWGRSGVRVNCVSPGFTRTPGTARGVAEGLLETDLFAQHSAFGRWLEVEEIANAVLFLTSDLASGISGINLPVDAGWLAASPWATYGGVRSARSQTGDAGTET